MPAGLIAVVIVLLLPGCFVFDLAFGLLGTAFDVLESALGALFFWAAPAPPGAALPPASAEAMGLSEALALAGVLQAETTPVLVPSESVPSFDPGPPPRPGAVLYGFAVFAD